MSWAASRTIFSLIACGWPDRSLCRSSDESAGGGEWDRTKAYSRRVRGFASNAPALTRRIGRRFSRADLGIMRALSCLISTMRRGRSPFRSRRISALRGSSCHAEQAPARAIGEFGPRVPNPERRSTPSRPAIRCACVWPKLVSAEAQMRCSCRSRPVVSLAADLRLPWRR